MQQLKVNGIFAGRFKDAAARERITALEGLLPAQATSENELADKEFVNSSINTATAAFRGTHATLAGLEAVTDADKNDYGYVEETDEAGNKTLKRYKYVEADGEEEAHWAYEYTINNSGFTTAEWAAIKSGITDGLVEKLRNLPTNAELTTALNNKSDSGHTHPFSAITGKPDTLAGYGITDAMTAAAITAAIKVETERATAKEVDLSRRTRKTDFDLAVLQKAVADQNLEKYGLKVGDQKTINGRTYVIAGLNPMKGTITPYRLTQNHVGLIVIPHTTQAWNASGNTYTGADGRGEGYANCDLHNYLKETLLPLVKTDLGEANLLAHSKLLGKAINKTGLNRFGENTGCTSSWDWVANQYICALSEVQVYGATVWSSSGYDTGEACRQLDVFRVYNHTEIFGGEYPWLRDVASASHAAYATADGIAANDPVSIARHVAALILFK